MSKIKVPKDQARGELLQHAGTGGYQSCFGGVHWSQRGCPFHEFGLSPGQTSKLESNIASALIAEARDGSKKVVAEKSHQ